MVHRLLDGLNRLAPEFRFIVWCALVIIPALGGAWGVYLIVIGTREMTLSVNTNQLFIGRLILGTGIFAVVTSPVIMCYSFIRARRLLRKWNAETASQH